MSDKYGKLSEILAATAMEMSPGGGRDFLTAASLQATGGKGIDRHAGGRPWLEQPIIAIQEAVGGGFALGQAMKKIQEAERLPRDRALEELKGAVIYLAGWHAMNEILWAGEARGIGDPALMAETAHFADVLRVVHQTLFCANGEQERAACRRAIAEVCELASCLAQTPE